MKLINKPNNQSIAREYISTTFTEFILYSSRLLILYRVTSHTKVGLAREQKTKSTNWINYLGQQTFQSLHLVLARVQLSAGQLEEGRAQLQQQHVWQSVFVDQQDSFDAAPHSDPVEFVAHPLESGRHRRVLLEQRVFGAESVVGQWIPAKKWEI